MPLSVTKGELNRLGDRLIATDSIAEADLEALAAVLADYQQVLERVKALLSDMGFASAAARVKTTGTLRDKLRRSPGMRLSRMQDLAGARVVVADVERQNEATDTICKSLEYEGCPCRVVDRRENPSFGYRAVHVVTHVDSMPVEIQIRTELQNTWAQIFERLGDQWGRGIRYGEDPESPDVTVRSGELRIARRQAIGILMQLSETIGMFEQARAEVADNRQALARLTPLIQGWKQLGPDGNPRLTGKIPQVLWPLRDELLNLSNKYAGSVNQDLMSAGPDMTGEQLVVLAEECHTVLSNKITERDMALRQSEQGLRGILQRIADATDNERE